jgi:cytolysin-activating lysine-acyltransferase
VPDIDPAFLARIAELRTHLRLAFGQVVMSMMVLPRYRHQTMMDLNHLVLEPLIRDRIAMAYASGKSAQEPGKPGPDIAGMAIWASVSEEVDARIREQIKAGVFPVRLKPDDWNSGEINWLLDVLANDKKTAGNVIANFKQVVKEGELRMHPIIGRLIDEEILAKMTRKPAQGTA